MRWSDLKPEPGIVSAIQHAGPRPEDGTQNEKRRWSEKFANGCAVAIAGQLRSSPVKKKRILPHDLDSGTEPLTPLGAGTSKRIDVTVADPMLGLEIGISLKGLNFSKGGNFDKNLTGRLYELGDEVRLVHEHLPHAFMVGIIFLPLDSTVDKKVGTSSFAHTVVKLRERTGRLDMALAGHAPRCDMSYAALYTIGNEKQGLPMGVTRFLNVSTSPPRRGRPRVEDTLDLQSMIDEVVAKVTYSAEVDWAPPESD